jgi:ACT domain
MLYSLRVRLPDRPGALAHLAALLAARALDVRSIEVLGCLDGEAVDHLLVSGDAVAVRSFADDLDRETGFAVLGLRRSVGAGKELAVVELLHDLAAEPGRGVGYVTAAAPVVLAADWAVAFDIAAGAGEPVVVTPCAPSVQWRGGPVPARATRVAQPTGAFAVAGHAAALLVTPFGAAHAIVVGRTAGPDFHPVEIERAARVVEAAAAVTAAVRAPGGRAVSAPAAG